jgi:hypothetical protein
MASPFIPVLYPAVSQGYCQSSWASWGMPVCLARPARTSSLLSAELSKEADEMKRSSQKNPVLWRLSSFILLWAMLLAPGLATANDLTVNGTYTVSGDISYDTEYVGGGGPTHEEIYQDNYTNTVNNTLEMGYYFKATGFYAGFYTLNGGTLSTYQTFVGSHGEGIFTQSGGTHTTEILTVGRFLGSIGTYEMTYGSSAPNLSAKNEVIGDEGSGTFNHHAGYNTVFYSLYVGKSKLGTGVYNNYGGWVQAGTE